MVINLKTKITQLIWNGSHLNNAGNDNNNYNNPVVITINGYRIMTYRTVKNGPTLYHGVYVSHLYNVSTIYMLYVHPSHVYTHVCFDQFRPPHS